MKIEREKISFREKLPRGKSLSSKSDKIKKKRHLSLLLDENVLFLKARHPLPPSYPSVGKNVAYFRKVN